MSSYLSENPGRFDSRSIDQGRIQLFNSLGDHPCLMVLASDVLLEHSPVPRKGELKAMRLGPGMLIRYLHMAILPVLCQASSLSIYVPN